MSSKQVAPYGSWKSPITSELIVKGSIGLGQIALDGSDIYWIEVRPQEGGRSCVVRLSADGRTEDLVPQNLNARTRVHEYGGGDYAVSDGTLYFSNFADQRIYRRRAGAEEPEALTPAEKMRYADMTVDAARGRLVCVREDHTESEREAVNTIVAVALDGNDAGQVLASGNDFYASPRLSPDGKRLAYLTWNHPNMPWDGTELWLCELDEEGGVRESKRVAGGPEESVFQPEWSPEGSLHFVSDRSGWWNLYRLKEGGDAEALCPMEADFGQPQWIFGMSMYAFESDAAIICAFIEKGRSRLARLDTASKRLERIETPYSDITYVRAGGGRALFRAGSPGEPASVVLLDLGTMKTEALRRATDLQIDDCYISIPEAIEFPTEDGLTAHGFYYAPHNCDYTAPEKSLPPLLVKSHGGPTAATSTTFALGIQYWTSRGIAVLDVNYGGSTGYGRAYRQRLNGRWGIVDVDDCVNGARYLIERGLADADACAIDGGSAGGYTTLCALTFRDLFRAGASHFGVSDLAALATETHKFESRYLDRLIGPYPERADLYRERSPLFFTDRLSCPVIFFQGLEDKIVLPNQAEMMVEALREKGLPVAYVPFEGEQHGFRIAENIRRALDGELYFYSRIFGFELAEEVEPVRIENLSR